MQTLTPKAARQAVKPSYHNRKAHIEQLNAAGVLEAPGLLGRSRFEGMPLPKVGWTPKHGTL